MSSNRTRWLTAGLASSLLWSSASLAAEETTPFTWGADLRLRQVFIGNVGLNEDSPTADRTFQRYRGRLWATYSPIEQLSGSARLMWEGRHYNKPNQDDYRLLETWYSGGILFDQLTLDVKNRLGGAPVALKLGRQDIRLGDGWLVLDGTPIDGSRTFYLDAARATIGLDSIGTTLDLIYLDQSANTGRFPQSLNGETEDQTEQNETGAILYAQNKSLVKDTALDGYFIYKHSRPERNPLNIRINNGFPFPSPSDSGDVYTFGLRGDSKPHPRWGLRAEGAYQWGTRNDRDLSAFGFTGRATYNLNDPKANRVYAGYEFLSGDDPGGDDQAFDPLWGRWPQWSELMVYQWPLETAGQDRIRGGSVLVVGCGALGGVAAEILVRAGVGTVTIVDRDTVEATNLQRLNLGWGMQAHPTTLVTLDYHALWADEESTRTRAQLVNISQDGNFRGHLATGWIRTKLNKHVSGHLVAEYLWPGDFYARNRRDESYFVRAELSLAW